MIEELLFGKLDEKMARALSNLGKAVLQQKAFTQQGAQGMMAVAGNKKCEHFSETRVNLN